MAGLKKEALWVRLFVLSAVLAIVAAACGTQEPAASDGAPDESAPAGSEPAASGGGGGGELGTYTLGIFEDVTTDNAWNYNDTEGSTVWNQYFLGTDAGARPTRSRSRASRCMPDLAEGELEPATEEGDGWVGTFALKEGLLWSDGEPITAEDLAFTWNTAVDLELQGGWDDYTDPDIITAVEAVDDTDGTGQLQRAARPGHLGHLAPASC